VNQRTGAIGPYRIEDVLGSGNMGIVYRARHHGTDQAVALKTVRAPREWNLQSIRREIRSLARLRHPGIVRILDEGVWDGLPWCAMELLDGTSLRVVCGAHAMSALDAMTVIRRLCVPLGFLHGEGVVHGDLKPDNVLLRPDGMPVLVDFGLASSFPGSVSREDLASGEDTGGTAHLHGAGADRG
jgi:serine/threonine protein kinase